MKTLRHFALLSVTILSLAMVSCETDSPYDPAKDPNNKTDPAEEPEKEYVVDQYGYATYTYQGFEFKFKESVIETNNAKKAIEHVRADLDKIVELIPESALNIMRRKPIWFEENNKQNSSAAWYHTWAEYPTTYGDLAAKGKCVEVTNYNYYVSWSNQNQPFMILHELCHLYHDQGLGGDNNTDITNAYNAAKKSGIYNKIYYRSHTTDPKNKWTETTSAYCMNTAWEYFAEMCEAYWGENDYYPFNYAQLKEFDTNGFNLMVKIWGARTDL